MKFDFLDKEDLSSRSGFSSQNSQKRQQQEKLKQQRISQINKFLNKREIQSKQTLNLQDALATTQIQKDKYSLVPDMILGWRPNKSAIKAPLPISFTQDIQQLVLEQLMKQKHKTNLSKIIYLGFRPQDSYEIHMRYSNLKLQQECVLYGLLQNQYKLKKEQQLNFKDQYINSYKFKTKLINLIYKEKEKSKIKYYLGMNPQINSNIIFDSDFESGNLDFVVQLGDQNFDLWLRADSNTKGHCQWFYFSIKSKINQSVKLTIVNLSKKNCLYADGMKPYIFDCSNVIKGWQQNPDMDVLWTNSSIFTKLKQYGLNIIQSGNLKQMSRITFQVNLKANTKYYLAYSEVYTYSMLITDINYLIKNQDKYKEEIKQQKINISKEQDMNAKLKLIKRLQFRQQLKLRVNYQYLGKTFSGLNIPLIIIYYLNRNNKKQKRSRVLIIGRVHPGESNGSLMMQGLMEQLIYKQNYANDFIEYHLVPMINVDGVIGGNFRTSFVGKDLNRQYGKNEKFMCPEISYITNLQKKYKYQAILDLHAHSSKQNIFIYGVTKKDNQKRRDYYEGRIFIQQMKIIQEKFLDVQQHCFDQKKCMFKLSNDKKQSCRGFFFNQGLIQSYTIECSNMGYIVMENNKQVIKYFGQNRNAIVNYGGVTLAQSINKMIERELRYQETLKENNIQYKTEQLISDSSFYNKIFSQEISLIDSNEVEQQMCVQTDSEGEGHDLDEKEFSKIKNEHYKKQVLFDKELKQIEIQIMNEKDGLSKKKNQTNQRKDYQKNIVVKNINNYNKLNTQERIAQFINNVNIKKQKQEDQELQKIKI